jgi:hypothetical protein
VPITASLIRKLGGLHAHFEWREAKVRSPIHMTPAPCPRQARASPPPRERRIAPQHAAHTPVHRPPRALSSALSPRPATPMPSPANTQHTLRTSNQHLPNIPSHGLALPLSCARARLPARVHPRRTVDLPRPRPPNSQPCLSTCALPARQTALLLILRARAQRSHRPHARPAVLNETAAAPSRALLPGAGSPVPRHPG